MRAPSSTPCEAPFVLPSPVATCRAYSRRDGSVGPLPDAELLVRALAAARPDKEETA